MPRTDWHISPSFRYDTLCLLNTLTGDPFYVEFNQAAYDEFAPRLTPEVKNALAELKRTLKDEGGNIISALLCLYYSAVEGETLDDMLYALDNPEPMQRGIQQSPYYEEAAWQSFMNSRESLRIIFQFLQNIDFPAYWQREILPGLTDEIHSIEAHLADYDVIEKLESMIGYTLPSPKIEIYVLHYTKPHGIKIIGQRFITAGAWGPNIVLRTAIHEMLHPPYDIDADKPLKAAIERLQQDAFVAEKFAGHNPDFGYNTFTGYVEENCVRALDQLVSEAFDVARNPQERWQQEDDGMHVLAAALYYLMKQAQFSGGFRDFLLSALQTHLAPGSVRAVYEAFYVGRLIKG